MGGCGAGHLGDGLYSPDDPIFYLLHGYVDMLWALWQDYHDYDLIPKEDIGNSVYRGDLSNSGIDTIMEFGIFASTSWSTLSGTDTMRDVHSLDDMGYKYDEGSFIADGNFQNANLNWFVDSSGRRRMQNTDSVSFDQMVYQRLVKEYYGGSVSNDPYDGKRQIMSTWSKMSCEYMNIGDNECERPRVFNDFSDHTLGPNMYNNRNDLNVT